MPKETPKLSLRTVEVAIAAVDQATFDGKNVEIVVQVKAELRTLRDHLKAEAAENKNQ